MLHHALRMFVLVDVVAVSHACSLPPLFFTQVAPSQRYTVVSFHRAPAATGVAPFHRAPFRVAIAERFEQRATNHLPVLTDMNDAVWTVGHGGSWRLALQKQTSVPTLAGLGRKGVIFGHYLPRI